MAITYLERSELPAEQSAMLYAGEAVCYFGYIDAKGGCATASRAKQWFMVTNQRIIFEAAVKQPGGKQPHYVHQSGAIPMAKVTYVGTITEEAMEGCAKKRTTNLKINSGGGEIIVAIPTKEEALRIQAIVDELITHGVN